jgi:hypothetical protein
MGRKMTRHDLELRDDTELAVMCGGVADKPSQYLTSISEKAQKLKHEWVSLQTAPNPDYALQKKIEEQRLDLKNRMIEFLASIL